MRANLRSLRSRQAMRLPLCVGIVAATAGVACAPLPAISCRISADGANIEMIASNTTGESFQCRIECDAVGDQTDVTYRCNETINVGASNLVVCSMKTFRPVKQVTQIRYTCSRN